MRPEYAPRVELDTRELDGGNEPQTDDAQVSVFDSGSESEQDEEEDDEHEVVPMETQVAEFRKVMQDAMALFEDQVAKGNEKFVERFLWLLTR